MADIDNDPRLSYMEGPVPQPSEQSQVLKPVESDQTVWDRIGAALSAQESAEIAAEHMYNMQVQAAADTAVAANQASQQPRQTELPPEPIQPQPQPGDMRGEPMNVRYDPATDVGSISARGQAEGMIGDKSVAEVAEAREMEAKLDKAIATLEAERERYRAMLQGMLQGAAGGRGLGAAFAPAEQGMVGSGDTPTRDN